MRERVYIDRHTKIDGKDIEFVLGNSPQGDRRIRRMNPLDKIMGTNVPTNTFGQVRYRFSPELHKRMTNLWSLDFDAYGSVTMDQATAGVFQNSMQYLKRFEIYSQGFQHQRFCSHREKPDAGYHYPYYGTLLSLYKDPKVSKKRKGHTQSEMRQSAIAVFEPGKEAAEAETPWCPIVKDFFPKRTIVAAHLVPYSLSKGVTKYLFGNGAPRQG
ncbi:hypothetical protein MMC22_002922 [Lobaria immixta]|nr:hypothetical protein [Lobaria immixta]